MSFHLTKPNKRLKKEGTQWFPRFPLRAWAALSIEQHRVALGLEHQGTIASFAIAPKSKQPQASRRHQESPLSIPSPYRSTWGDKLGMTPFAPTKVYHFSGYYCWRDPLERMPYACRTNKHLSSLQEIIATRERSIRNGNHQSPSMLVVHVCQVFYAKNFNSIEKTGTKFSLH